MAGIARKTKRNASDMRDEERERTVGWMTRWRRHVRDYEVRFLFRSPSSSTHLTYFR